MGLRVGCGSLLHDDGDGFAVFCWDHPEKTCGSENGLLKRVLLQFVVLFWRPLRAFSFLTKK